MMRDITQEARVTVTGRYPRRDPMPPRGCADCICKEKAPRDEFVMLADRSGTVVWYARKSCPIHGITVTETDLPASPPMDTATASSTTES